MSMGMIRMTRASISGMGMEAAVLDSFNDPIPSNTASEEAARAIAVSEKAKAAVTEAARVQLAWEAQNILNHAKALAVKEAEVAKKPPAPTSTTNTTTAGTTGTKDKDKVALVETGADTGKILGMDSATFMLVAAAAAVMLMMEKK